MNAATFPVTIQPDAAARLSQLQLHIDLDEVLEYSARVIPTIRSIEIETYRDIESPDQASLRVVIWANINHPENDSVRRAWHRGLGKVISATLQRWSVIHLFEDEASNGG